MSAALLLPGGLSLASPWLLALALLPLAALALRRAAPALLYAPSVLLEGAGPALPSTARTRLTWLPGALTALGLLLVVLALARPQARLAAPPTARGIDVLLCLDRSSSMAAQDLAPGRTRLQVAQAEALRFVDGRPHDRVGLLGFARYPDLLCPPTLDHAALAALLSPLAPVLSDSAEDATGIGTAVARAAEVLDAAEAAAGRPVPSRVVLLLTDGEENVAQPGASGEITPLHAAQLCARLGVRVYVVLAGAGRPPDPGTQAPESPAPDARALEARAALEALAQRTGGLLLSARDEQGLRDAYAEVDALETTVFDAGRTQREERFLPFLLAGIALLLAARLLAAGPLRVAP